MRTSTVAAALEDAASIDRVFLNHGDEEFTYRQVDAAADRFASALLARGIGRGDRIGLYAPNSPEWLITFFAAAKIGAIVVTLSVRYREREFDHMVGQSGARTLVGIARTPDFDFTTFFDGFREKLPGVERYVFIGDGAGGFSGSESFADLLGTSVDAPTDNGSLAVARSRVTPDDPLLILYTSGTTGNPKGAVITHRSLLAAARAQVDHCGITGDDVVLGHLPFNHVAGITCTITTALVTRGRVPLVPAFSPDAALRAIERHRVTVLGGVPTMFTLMAKQMAEGSYDVSAVRNCTVGGSNVEPALCEAVTRGFPGARLYGLYGLSETSGACVLTRPDDDPATVGRTLGVAIGDFEARVVGLDGTVQPPGNTGELQVRGDCVARGYWNMDEETVRVFLPGGWLATGDMVTAEPDGHFVLEGRKKEMYIQGGFNVYPVETENILTTHPGVAMAAGIGIPDEVLGEVGRFYIVPRDGRTPTTEELTAYCQERLADYKVPRQFVFTDTLPLTPVGKVRKATLKEAYLTER